MKHDITYYVEGEYLNGDEFYEGTWENLDDLIDETNALHNDGLKYPIGVFKQVENWKGDLITETLFYFNR